VSSLQELLDQRAGLRGAPVARLLAITADWQILADLSFSDLLMYARDPRTGIFTVIAQMRPYTAQTVHQEDLVGREFTAEEKPLVARAFVEQVIVKDGEPDWSAGVPLREEAIPVPFGGETIAVVTRENSLSTVRSPSGLELTYLQVANELSLMLAEGAFPYPGDDPEHELAPRVGDGMMRLDATGVVAYASPNAVSAYRRLGIVENVVGHDLRAFDPDPEAVIYALTQGKPIEAEIEAYGVVVLRRVLPLVRGGHVRGALVLLREVTELRRHERLLLYKDATIREIHHRVKNNLQTVASLLRLQSRRLKSDEARAALAESVRRISSIALVHETLSQDSRQRVTFDSVAERLVNMLTQGLTDPNRPVTVTTQGEAGELPAELATPLALVLSELLQNAVEHAFPTAGGQILVRFERRSNSLDVAVIDDGVGLDADWSLEKSANLGLRIASTLVESELGGTLEVKPAANGSGTHCEILIPLS
jgi:two-component sensor histidine kinase